MNQFSRRLISVLLLIFIYISFTVSIIVLISIYISFTVFVLISNYISFNKNYICSDPSRQIFKFKNSEGNVEKDFKAIKLTNMLIDAGISSKSYEVAQTLWTNEDGGIDANKFEQYGPSHLEITELNMDNSVFRNKLAILTSL